jgi:hypothetical protein
LVYNWIKTLSFRASPKHPRISLNDAPGISDILFSQMLRKDVENWAKVIKAADIRLNGSP